MGDDPRGRRRLSPMDAKRLSLTGAASCSGLPQYLRASEALAASSADAGFTVSMEFLILRGNCTVGGRTERVFPVHLAASVF